MAKRREIVDALLFIPGMLLAGLVIFAGVAAVGLYGKFIGTGIYVVARDWLHFHPLLAALASLVGTIFAVCGTVVFISRRL
jgi:hypothetical protein